MYEHSSHILSESGFRHETLNAFLAEVKKAYRTVALNRHLVDQTIALMNQIENRLCAKSTSVGQQYLGQSDHVLKLHNVMMLVRLQSDLASALTRLLATAARKVETELCKFTLMSLASSKRDGEKSDQGNVLRLPPKFIALAQGRSLRMLVDSTIAFLATIDTVAETLAVAQKETLSVLLLELEGLNG